MTKTAPVAPAGLALDALATALGAELHGDGRVRVCELRHDSRAIAPGELFVALAGAHADGAAFAPAAVARGAAAVLAERFVPGLGAPLLVVSDARAALGRATALLHGDASHGLRVVAITGTNGKTTTVELVRALLADAGAKPATMGTLGVHCAGVAHPSALVTPEADDGSRLCARLARAGADHLVLEATSHALAMRRLDALPIAVAGFTNLTHDHLDVHPSFEAYGRAKARLFRELAPARAVLDVDDPFGAELARELGARAVRVSRSRGADVWASNAVCDAHGIGADVATPAGRFALRAPLLGEHNLSNVLLALGLAHALGLDLARAVEVLATASAPPGRLQRCDARDDDIVVLVDYAHSPHALAAALAAARLLVRAPHALSCVFGCGGERDATKREPMGAVAGRDADRIIVTSDNPRGEAPEAIARAILPGVARGRAERAERHGHERMSAARVELDRGRAIALAVAEAAPGDVVLVAGKGHEQEQIAGSERRPFDDREQVRDALARRRARANGTHPPGTRG